MKLLVKTLKGDKFVVEVDETNTVAEVKGIIVRITGIETVVMYEWDTLVFRGILAIGCGPQRKVAEQGIVKELRKVVCNEWRGRMCAAPFATGSLALKSTRNTMHRSRSSIIMGAKGVQCDAVQVFKNAPFWETRCI